MPRNSNKTTVMRLHLPVLSLLLSGALYIWLHDLSWWQNSPSAVLLALGLPATLYFGWPWQQRSTPKPPSQSLLISGALLFLAGILTEFTMLLVFGWVLLAWHYMDSCFTPRTSVKPQRLLPFLILAFPWIVLEGDIIGWYFRLSGAWVNEWLFTLGGLDVHREGVNILLNGLPIDIVDDCNGLDTLQAMLATGGVLGYLFFHQARHYWFVWPLLIVFAWISNTLRIFIFSIVGLSYGSEFVMGEFHDWGGMLVVTTMFALCVLVFNILDNEPETS